MPETIYRLEGITKRYGDKEACSIDELEIYSGEILCVMGPNGAGKSTLLRLLNFLESPCSGSIYFYGNKLNNSKLPLSFRRQVAMVFQDPLLLSSTVEDNVAFGLKVRGKDNIRYQVLQALEKVGLSHLAKANASTLSGGEAQRVALARALVIEPKVLLLDEPTANLDPYTTALIEDIIITINKERGTTVVLVTQNVFQAKRLTHRVLFLLGGKVVEIGKTEEVFNHPCDSRTAAFIRGELVY